MKLFLIVFLGTACISCSPSARLQPSLLAGESRTSRITFQVPNGNISFEVEIAQTSFSRQRGLMFRKNMADNKGMLFIFELEMEQIFWMKNTLIPLDLIFLNNKKKVVGIIENTSPQSLAPLTVYLPSLYVLEINGGLAQKHGIKKNMQAIFSISNF
jgi:uncharacterized protein